MTAPLSSGDVGVRDPPRGEDDRSRFRFEGLLPDRDGIFAFEDVKALVADALAAEQRDPQRVGLRGRYRFRRRGRFFRRGPLGGRGFGSARLPAPLIPPTADGASPLTKLPGAHMYGPAY